MIGLLLVSAGLAAAPEATAHPDKVLLGETQEVTVEVRASSVRDLHARASTGTLTGPQLTATGIAQYTWRPPQARYPHTALLLFWTEGGNAIPDLAVVRLPLIGRTDLEVNTEPRAEVRVEVGDRTFGPRKADGRGHAVIPVEVPPGVDTAKVLSEVSGTSKTVTVGLDPPPFNHLAAVAGPEPLPRSGGWAWVVATDALDASALKMEASAGSVSPWPSPPATYPDRLLLQVRPSGDAPAVTLKFRTAAPKDEAQVTLPLEEPAVARPHALERPLLQPGAMLGVTFAGGSNLSVLGSLAVEVSFPPLGTAFAAGLALEGNTLGLSAQVPVLAGHLDSWVLSLSPLVVARYQLYEVGPVAFHARLGAGPVLFVHQVRTDFEPAWTETGASVQGFLGGQITYRVGPLDLLLDLRASYGRVQTAQLDANIGGMVFGLGARVIR